MARVRLDLVALLLDPSQPEQLQLAADTLRAGTPVALPTETVYGLAALAESAPALARIFALKARPSFDPLIVHVLDLAHARTYAQKVELLHERLAAAFWPGPLTMLFARNERVPELCTAGSAWLAMRSPRHPVFRALLEKVGQGLAAPSANRFGRISPTRSEHVLQELGPHGLEAVVEGGPCDLGLESTVVKIHGEQDIEVIRLGALSLEALQKETGSGVRIRVRASGTGAMEESPGQLSRHYAPRVPLVFVREADKARVLAQLKGEDLRRCALLSPFPELGAEWHELAWGKQVTLSESALDTEAAARLFGAMRELEGGNYRMIYALDAGERGLGPAINDRLRRAAN